MRCFCAVALIVAFSTAVYAQVPAGNWAAVDRLGHGTRDVEVMLLSGMGLSGIFSESTPDSLVINVSGMLQRFAKSDVQSVSRTVQSGKRKGVLIGMALGFAGGAVSGYAASTAAASTSLRGSPYQSWARRLRALAH